METHCKDHTDNDGGKENIKDKIVCCPHLFFLSSFIVLKIIISQEKDPDKSNPSLFDQVSLISDYPQLGQNYFIVWFSRDFGPTAG